MNRSRRPSRHAIVLCAVVLAAGAVGLSPGAYAAAPPAAPPAGAAWPERGLAGSTVLAGQVPLAVTGSTAGYVGQHPTNALITLNFGFPIRDRAGLDALIQQQSVTHRYLTRDQLYVRFSPPPEQLAALATWLKANGFRVTHVGADRLSMAAVGTTAAVERALRVTINDYARSASTIHGVKVAAYQFYANTTAPVLPARLGIQSISGLSNVDRFFTQAQIDAGTTDPVALNAPDVRSGGYWPVDLRGLYNITGHGFDATGQTIGFTLWTTPERQAAMTAFAATTGDQLITVDMPSCVATGNSPTTPSSCSTVVVQPDHLLTILENGNTDANSNFGSNVETALDIQAAHAVATHVAMKYYAEGCATNPQPGSGLSNAGCNGTDVGMEEAMEDAANDPTLHSVSNSWGYGGEAEWGLADPFIIASDNILALGAAAGTTFYFSTGDAGTYQSGTMSDSRYVVAVGGTSTYSTSASGTWSTSTTWSGGGSWCSNIFTRPSWQVAPGLVDAACPGRANPDVSAVADPNTGVRFTASTNLTGGTSSGQVGGTSLAAPVMNGLQALTQNFIKAQTYPGATPPIGFEAPVMYQLGNSGHADSYYRDIECGNTANPTSGPDGDAAGRGWDPATGWGEPDWYQYSIGYAIQLGATNLSVPPSLSRNFGWTCAKTPSNSTERGFSFPTTSVGYAVGSASGGTPWYGKFLSSGAWGAVNTFFKTTDGGQTWFPSNSDMFSVTCTSASTCVEVGAGGRERRTTDGGTTWSDVATAPGNNKPLTQVTCPSSSICYAAGDRGNVMKSTDGGATWTWLASTAANPIYGLSCPTTSVCYAADLYAHIVKTTDGGATWTWQTTPITTPGAYQVAETGGPNPYAGLLSISCSDANTCVASGLYVIASGQALPSSDPPIITTTDGGTTWVRQTSHGGGTQSSSTTLAAATVVGATNIKTASVNSLVAGQSIIVDSTGANPETVTVISVGTSSAGGTGTNITPALAFAHASGATVSILAPNYLHSMSCLPGTTTCTAVGRNGAIVSTTDLVTWTKAVSGTTNLLNNVTCLSASFCMAVGQNGTVDVFNGTTWTATTGNGGTGMLAGVTCLDANNCYATGKQGVTIATTNGGTTWTQQAGGGTTQQMNSISCPDASTCYAAGNAGTILKTTNGGQTWLAATSGTTQNLTGISCATTSACATVGVTSTTSLSAASAVGATNIKVASVTGLIAGQQITVDSGGANPENATILTVGTSGAGGTGLTLTAALAFAHASGATVTTVPATVRYTTDGSTWNGGTGTGANTLNGVACTSASACLAVGLTGSVLASADGGATWSPKTSGVTAALNAITCPAGACYATGAVAGGAAVMLKSTDGGTTWTPQASGTANPLSGIACVTAARCFADGTFGTVIETINGGTTWSQQGNPLSGPTSALNATSLALNGAACTSARCVIGTGAQGDILMSQLLSSTATTVTADFDPTQFGHPVTFTATVVPVVPAPDVPSGNVQWWLDGVAVGAPASLDATGRATWMTSSLALGTHVVGAVYLGAGGFDPSTSPSINHTVKKRLATTTAVSAGPSLVYGAPWTLDATVTPENASTGIAPTGTLQLMVNGATLMTGSPAAPVKLPIAGGTIATSDFSITINCTWVPPLHCTITINWLASTALKAGNNSVRAVYSGDVNYTGSTSPSVVQRVTKATPTGTVTSAPLTPITFGEKPTFTATFVNPVAPVGSLAPGSVQFLIDGTNMGAAVAISAGGIATFTPTWNLPAGTHTVKAHYLGDVDFAAVLSAPYTLKINP